MFDSDGVDNRCTAYELERTMASANAPWDRRMLHVAEGAAVADAAGDSAESMPSVVTVPSIRR